MFPMMVKSAEKAKLNVEQSSKKSKLSSKTNPELEKFQQDCYEELFAACNRLASERNMKMGSLLSLNVSNSIAVKVSGLFPFFFF